jgi:hypothetical protein
LSASPDQSGRFCAFHYLAPNRLNISERSSGLM